MLIVYVQLIDYNIVRLDPGDEREDAQALPDEAREPVPDEAADHHVQKPTVARKAPAIRCGRIRWDAIMQSVEKSGVGQDAGPDHCSGPYEEAAEGACESEADDLCERQRHIASTRGLLSKHAPGWRW